MHRDWDWQYSSLTCPILVDDQQIEAKAEQAPPPVKKELPIVAETKVLDGAAPVAPSGKKKNSAKKQKTEPGIDDICSPEIFPVFKCTRKCNEKLSLFQWMKPML